MSDEIEEKDELKKWILQEMTVDVKEKLSAHKNRVKEYIELTANGEITLKNVNNIPEWGKIALYMIGKLYAHYAGFTAREVDTKELVSTLHMPEGTVKSSIFKLRREGWIDSTEGRYQMRYGSLGSIFRQISQTGK